MSRNLFRMLCCLVMTGCVTTNTGGGMLAIVAGAPCFAGQTQVCSYSQDQSAILRCQNNYWVLEQVCATGQTCRFQSGIGSPLACISDQADVKNSSYDSLQGDAGSYEIGSGHDVGSDVDVTDAGALYSDVSSEDPVDAGPSSPDATQDTTQDATQPPQVFQSMPKWNLQDIQSKSPGYGQSYGLDKFQGKRVVLLMGAAWCASCMAQAKIMEKVRNEMKAAGTSDFEMAVIVDPNGPGGMVNTTSFPVFKGSWSMHKQPLPSGQIRTGAKNDAFAYDHSGRLIGFFQGAGTVYTNYYDDFVRKTLKAPDSPTFFMACPNAGGSGGCKIQP